MMSKFQGLFIVIYFFCSCESPQFTKVDITRDSTAAMESKQGTFGYDRYFLSKFDSLIILQNNNGQSRVIVSPKYQGKVFTSTVEGDNGRSFGWINYKAFTDSVNPHMNAYGGENRLWLGPEGGPFSLFFPKGSVMDFEHWKTPAPFDTEAWVVRGVDSSQVLLQKLARLTNYAGTTLQFEIDRNISMLTSDSIEKMVGVTLDSSTHSVGYTTKNIIINKGENEWNEKTGMPCIWMLDMFIPGEATTIIIPYKVDTGSSKKYVNANYFGEIPRDRMKMGDGILFFKADGKMRGKLGMQPFCAKNLAGSFDPHSNVLTIAFFDIDNNKKYINQEWTTSKPPFSGDAVNAYNDGPLKDGTQMGPFYEIESVSPPAFLEPGESLVHTHSVLHFTGSRSGLDLLCHKLFGLKLVEIEKAF